jgi:hypothetical protein
MLSYSVEEIIGHSDVEGSGAACQDVNVVLVVVEPHEGRVAWAIQTRANAKAKADPPPSAKDDN